MEVALVPSYARTDGSSHSSTSRGSKFVDDVASLTSFNPFSEEDDNDQSSYAIMSSLLSKFKNTFAAPLASAIQPSPPPSSNTPITPPMPSSPPAPSRPSTSVIQSAHSHESSRSSNERPAQLSMASSNVAPPLISLTPVVSETPSFNVENDSRPPTHGGLITPSISEAFYGAAYGTTIPGFPIQDDARSIRTMTSIKRSDSVTKVMRRIRGEGLSREYWMDDENCKECYDCKSVFTAWRRKHHCRICGSIYCSRCASNIIKGYRFGHNGMIRVCNLCLEKLATVGEDDDDDRRSIASSAVTTPFTAHQFGPSEVPMSLHSQSPFSASQLFGRSGESFNLFSIAETRKRPASGSDDGAVGSRSVTPDDLTPQCVNGPRKVVAPFRRAFVDEEKFNDPLSTSYASLNSPAAVRSKTPVDFPVTVPVTDGTTSTIQFPQSSPDRSGDSPGPFGRARYDSYAEFDGHTPFIRSRVQSRLVDLMIGEPGWRERRESTAYAQELNLMSMFHLRLMLRQMLTREAVPNLPEWEETLLRLALRIARELTFTAYPQRQGADMDVRRYVKIKKVPGGSPKDSECVDGAVITKNVAHKSMSRQQRNPRVMLVSFPLEFSRVEGQYMHFGQILRQEKEYLGNLTSRILALRPHVVLVEKSVSRLVLDDLAKNNIAVARAVKPSAVQFVARMTQADILSSIDKLALEPRLGHSSRFSVQTFDHPLIPGRRKSYMRFEGCNREMGCTIILRGGNLDTLQRIKKVTRFLMFIVRNLKLETHLWKDSVISLPNLTIDAVPAPYNPSAHQSVPLSVTLARFAAAPLTATPAPSQAFIEEFVGVEDDLPDEDLEQLRLSRRIQQSLAPYLTTFISVSATLRFPPPYPLRRMKELDDKLIRVKQAWEDEVVRREESQHSRTEAATPSTSFSSADVETSVFNCDNVGSQIESLACPDISCIPSEIPKTPTQGQPRQNNAGYFDFINPSSSSQTSSGSSTLAVSPGPVLPQTPLEEPAIMPKTVDDIALESELSYVKWQHQEEQRIWEWYLRKNADDFVVEKYQFISLWESILPSPEYGALPPCFPPSLKYVTYYGENDCTLGQFIDSSVAEMITWTIDPKQPACTGKGCNLPAARHCKSYVHNESRVLIAIEPWDGQIIGTDSSPSPELITTWSACRICGSATPFIPVSEEMQRYSFAKFLELHFYPADVQLVQGAGCEHNIYQHHIRFFAARGMTVRIQTDPVVLHEVVYPPRRIRVRPETQLELKNQDYLRLQQRSFRWYSALVDDLKLINIDAATGDEEADARLTATVNRLIYRAEAEKVEVTRLLNAIYRETAPTDTLALNRLRSFRQDKIVAWEADFDKLPKPRPVDREKLSKRSSTFGTMRAMWPRRYDLAGTYDSSAAPSSSVSEAEENVPPSRRLTGDSMMSSASDMSDSESPRDSTIRRRNPRDSGSTLTVTGLPPLDSPVPEETPTSASDAPKSDPDSDSTIGAIKDDAQLSGENDKQTPLPLQSPLVAGDPPADNPPRPSSRLPRPSQQPSVAELVKRYQEYLPSQGIEDLAKTALPPPRPSHPTESDQEFPYSLPPPARNRLRHPVPRKTSTSDVEQSYAASIGQRYLTQSRRKNQQTSRIPGPIVTSAESQEPSRQPSPEKRGSGDSNQLPLRGLRSPPPNLRPSSSKISRGTVKDRTLPRSPSSTGLKTTFRRPSGPFPGNRVSNIAKHFERISKDNERANRRYAVIRGRRARPVVSARARVEILDSVKDAIKDEESESSDSSSEADDEGGDEDDLRKTSPDKVSPESSTQLPALAVQPPSGAPSAATSPAAQAQPLPPVSSASILVPDTVPEDAVAPPVPEPSVSPSYSPNMAPVPKDSLLPDIDLGMPMDQRSSIMKALSGFWPREQMSTRVRQDLETEDPTIDPEHIFRDSSMVVRTDEPTSIIALALTSPQYRDMLTKSRAEKRQAREAKIISEAGEAFMPDDRSIAESSSTWGVVNLEASEGLNPTDDLRLPSSKLPWAITFESGGLTISCTVLFPEHFDALRRTYDCEKSMIESLARCIKWNASGGKSGSAFLKTQDDRFIAKEMSRAEVQTMETFAPAYFDYMSSAVSANRPTLLAKIFGCYKISFKRNDDKDRKSGKTKVTQMNLLVMENLFYDRRFSKASFLWICASIYDLKGSTRNRHVQSTGRENEVLLDENLVQLAHLSPFYVREHSKRILRGALFNDSKFLADINVMDYSLVVGVDSQKSELVVGIVDYVRTYTWDKKLESWVKESAFLGGAGKGEPTIVTPRQYRQRFLAAMERYFPLVPDRWMKQRDTPDDEGNALLDLWPDW
ncbi:hypothetical protein K488DRAFT_43997 [Vararia minispora EC-137]|uniref:Uncharacterized protein n=1 Tax=Vararia minispora EC-137 TaxID=1314806 RepID=A0ACB8QU46_9AGAM|nr:hypothetical protein K488DRAFT_43997 [Vararia minispora EC-137]